MIFAQMLEIVALSDLASLLCARKFSFASQGSVPQIALFGPPHRGWDLWFSLRPFVGPFVRPAEMSKSVDRNFLIFGTKLGLPNATEVTFSDFARKISFGRFWPILVKKWPFLAKYQRLG